MNEDFNPKSPQMEFITPNPFFIIEQMRRSQDLMLVGDQLSTISNLFNHFSKIGRKLCNEFNEVCSHLNDMEIVCTDSSYEPLVQSFQATANAFNSHFKNVSENVISPLNNFVKNDLESLNQIRKQYEHSSSAYNSFIEKHVSASQKSEKDNQSLVQYHQQVTQSFFDFSSKMSKIEQKLKEVMPNLYISYLKSFRHCFSKNLKIVNSHKQKFAGIELAALEASAQYRDLELKELRERQELDELIPRFWKYVASNQEPDEYRKSMQGFLWKKTRFNYKKKFFIVSNGVLSFAKNVELVLKSPKNIDLTLCAVKTETGQQRRNTFSVRSQQKCLVLQALTTWEMNIWIKAIEHNILSHAEGYNVPVSNSSPLLVNICADCGASCANWISVNWGITLCQNCAGVHRSLSNAISYVRSLDLDDILPIHKELIENIGTDIANGILEAKLEPDQKINQSTNVQQRRTFIQQKYLALKFVDKSNASAYDIYESIKSKDLMSVYKSIVVSKNNIQETVQAFTPLHAAVCIGNPLIIDLVFLHCPTSINEVDEYGWSPLCYATYNQSEVLVDFLLDCGADPDSSMVHPWTIAKALRNRDIEVKLAAVSVEKPDSYTLPDVRPHADFEFHQDDLSILSSALPGHSTRRLSNFIDNELRTTIKKFQSKQHTVGSHNGVKTLNDM